VRVVDPHIHLWDTRRVSLPWLARPAPAYSGDNRLLPQCHDVAAFLSSAGAIEVAMSVNIEANPADPLAEAHWLQSLADEPANKGHPHGIVACADLSRADTPVLLERLNETRNLRGIRQILNVHPDPRYDYVGRHYMQEPLWRENLKRLARYGWSFDLQIYPSQASLAIEVIRDHPDITFIVNHCGMFVNRNHASGWREWRDSLHAVADCENTALKLSGLAMFDHQWTVESLRPYVLEGIAAFGESRCMFASNFPIDGLHSTYTTLWTAYAQIVSGASASEQEQLFAGNARRYYRLGRGAA
jgi:predicted TIM-barrel fold metal-dependent hydrolase